MCLMPPSLGSSSLSLNSSADWCLHFRGDRRALCTDCRLANGTDLWHLCHGASRRCGWTDTGTAHPGSIGWGKSGGLAHYVVYFRHALWSVGGFFICTYPRSHPGFHHCLLEGMETEKSRGVFRSGRAEGAERNFST